MSTKEEWDYFVDLLRIDGIPETDTLRSLWSLIASDGHTPKNWKVVERYLAERFLKVKAYNDSTCKALARVEAASSQLQTLCATQENTSENPKTLSKLLSMCDHNGRTIQQCAVEVESACSKAAIGLEVQRLRNIVQRLCVKTATTPNPHQWQRDNVLFVEQKASARRVLSLNHVRYSKKQHDSDPWLLTQGAIRICFGVMVREAECVTADGNRRPAYVVELAPPDATGRRAARMANQARALAWRCYEAHRSLSTVAENKGVPQVFGWFQDDPALKNQNPRQQGTTRLLFERPNAIGLRSILVDRYHTSLEPNSPLIRHWLRETLALLADIDAMATHSLLSSISAQNIWVTPHGATLRLCGLRWGPELPHDTMNATMALHKRRSQLLAGFANVAEELIAALCSTPREAALQHKRENCSFRENDIKGTPIRVYPGQNFDLVLNTPTETPSARWVYHEHKADFVTAHHSPDWDNRLHFSALRPGQIDTVLSCITSAGVTVATLKLRIIVTTPRATGQLCSIIRSCRSFGTFCYDQLLSEQMTNFPVLAPAALLSSHAYFQPLSKKELLDAMASYEHMVTAPSNNKEEQQHSGHTGNEVGHRLGTCLEQNEKEPNDLDDHCDSNDDDDDDKYTGKYLFHHGHTRRRDKTKMNKLPEGHFRLGRAKSQLLARAVSN